MTIIDKNFMTDIRQIKAWTQASTIRSQICYDIIFKGVRVFQIVDPFLFWAI